MQALVLAAGLGTRLWPLTADRAKPAVPFLGQPLVRKITSDLLQAGFRVTVNTHYQPDSVVKSLAGFDVQFSHEREILGTGGAIGKAIADRLIDPSLPLLVVNGKLYTEIDYQKAYLEHQNHRPAISMVLKLNSKRELFREIRVDDRTVVGFEEGRQPVSSHPWLFTGIHILGPAPLGAARPVFSDSIQEIYPPFIESGQVHAIFSEARWWEFSTIERYLDLHREAARLQLLDNSGIDAKAVIDPQATLTNCVVWEGATVEADVRLTDCVVGADVRIPTGTSLSQKVLVNEAILGARPLENQSGQRLKGSNPPVCCFPVKSQA